MWFCGLGRAFWWIIWKLSWNSEGNFKRIVMKNRKKNRKISGFQGSFMSKGFEPDFFFKLENQDLNLET